MTIITSMEQQRTLELNLISAKDLENLNLFSKMDVYAVVSITGDSFNHNQNVKTPIDTEGGTNPVWNFPIKLTFSDTQARQNRLTLEVHLRCVSALAADNDVGRIHVPLAELLNQSSGNEGKPLQNVTYEVRGPSGGPKGSLNFSYKFGDEVTTADPVNATPHKAEPVVVHSPPVTGSCSKSFAMAYPPPPPGQRQYPAGHGYPQGQPAYGYRPPHAGYGYPPPHCGNWCPPPPHGGYWYPPPHNGHWHEHPPPHGGNWQQQGGLLNGLSIVGMVANSVHSIGNMVAAGIGLWTGDMFSDSFDDDSGFD